MRDDLIKFSLKVVDENQDKLVWEHFCYAPRELYLKFIELNHIERFEMADWVSRWAREDFNVEIAVTTSKDISLLKVLIMDKYSTVYPHLIRQSHTDRQGWIRVWVSTHMEREMRKNGWIR